MSKAYDKKDIDRYDSDLYRPTSIKDTIQWFPVLVIMKHIANILNQNNGIITSLLKFFAMFELR